MNGSAVTEGTNPEQRSEYPLIVIGEKLTERETPGVMALSQNKMPIKSSTSFSKYLSQDQAPEGIEARQQEREKAGEKRYLSPVMEPERNAEEPGVEKFPTAILVPHVIAMSGASGQTWARLSGKRKGSY